MGSSIKHLWNVQMYTSNHPFHDHLYDIAVTIKLMHGDRPARPSQEECSPAMADVVWQLIEDAWQQNPDTRPSMFELEKRFRPTDIATTLSRSSSSDRLGHDASHRDYVGYVQAMSLLPPLRATPAVDPTSPNISNETEPQDDSIFLPQSSRPGQVQQSPIEAKTTTCGAKSTCAEEELARGSDGSIEFGTVQALVEYLTSELAGE
jgi:hypothetical protein